jgi:hypothetical protein
MSTVEEIVNAAKALPPEDQAELKRRLDTLENDGAQDDKGQTAQHPNDLHERIHRALYEAGLVKEAAPPPRRPRQRPPPIKIRGKPLSETIIEDRR